MTREPTRVEIILTRLAFLVYGKSVYKEFADRLPLQGGERVLDFGCGMGTVAYYTAKRLSEGYLTCLDISGRWLNACRKTMRGHSNVSFVCAEATALPPNSLDVIYCHFVLHDISPSDLEIVFPALVCSLKPGGSLVFREPLNEDEALRTIKRLAEHNGLALKDSRVTHVPLMGSTLESMYVKTPWEVLS
mgnify:FL=1|jgi:ubiquinone/menaquinone biosynthesis C-methylase UbiE